MHELPISFVPEMLFADLGDFGAEPTDPTRRSGDRVDGSSCTYFQKVGISINRVLHGSRFEPFSNASDGFEASKVSFQ